VTFTLVFVCTANRGRSPVAEAVVRQLMPAGVEVSSCGVHAAPGLPPLQSVLDAAMARQIDIASHRSRPLESIADTDLVVGFEHIHVATSVVDGGAHRDRVFTLPELVRLLGRTGSPASPAARIEAAAEIRARERADAQTVVDPAGRSKATVDKIVAEIDILTRRLIGELFG
jgi:protein-tyrosine-phosphatase